MINKKLNIGISCYPTFGGSGVIATEIGLAMAELGHKVHFICYDMPRRLQEFSQNLYFHEVEVQDYPLFTYPPYSLSLASKIVEVSTYEELDIIHAHYAVPHATSAYLAKQVLGEAAPKVITTLHGTDITLVGNNRSYLPITRFSIEQSDGITAPSRSLVNSTYDKLNIKTHKEIEVIPNFVDTKRYSPCVNQEPMSSLLGTCKKSDKTLCHVSNFRAVKRVEDVVRVFDRVNKEEACHLVLVGDGPERSKVENLVYDLDLKDKVCFLGKQSSFIEILQKADLFLLPSESESFGLAALEAMSCGVPVIGSNIQGIPEVVSDGETGFLSDVGNIEDMASNALRLLRDQQLLNSFSKAARERVVSNFSKESLIPKYEDYYYRILA